MGCSSYSQKEDLGSLIIDVLLIISILGISNNLCPFCGFDDVRGHELPFTLSKFILHENLFSLNL